MADVTSNLPVLDFSEVSRAQAYKRQALAPTEKGTIVQGVVDKVTVTETSDKSRNPGSLQFIFELRPLNAQGKPVSQTVRHYVPIPKVNSGRPGHGLSREEVTEGYRKCREVIRALMGSDTLPAGPRKVEGTDKWADVNGKELTRDEMNTMNAASTAAVDEVLKKWYCIDPATGRRGFEDLKGALLFLTLRRSDSGYTNVGYIRHDAGDAQLVPATFITAD